MRLWRLCRQVYAGSAFSGEGARRAGGRWNHRGVSVAYATTHLSLAVLEVLVHVDPDDLPSDLVSVEADLPDDVAVETVDIASLPADWRAVPGPDVLKDLGAAWLRLSDFLCNLAFRPELVGGVKLQRATEVLKGADGDDERATLMAA